LYCAFDLPPCSASSFVDSKSDVWPSNKYQDDPTDYLEYQLLAAAPHKSRQNNYFCRIWEYSKNRIPESEELKNKEFLIGIDAVAFMLTEMSEQIAREMYKAKYENEARSKAIAWTHRFKDFERE